MPDDVWIRPLATTLPLIPSADREVRHRGIRYAVAHARVERVAHEPADEVPGVPTPRVTPGPFQVGPLCIGKVVEDSESHIEADWYFEIF